MHTDLLGVTIETYVDDMLIKSRYQNSHLEDMMKRFEIMERFNIRLNPKKCTLAVKFLGFMMTRSGIEPNPEKVKAITEIKPLCLIKDVQKLTGRLAALNRFLSKYAKKSLSFFHILKKVKAFEWT